MNARNRRKGWKDTTIRAILHNESYTGGWKYKAKEWRKVPGTNIRRYRKRDDSEVIRRRGSGANAYYRCEAHNKRGTCENDLSVRECAVRESVLDEIRHRLASDEGVRYARQRVAEVLGALARESGSKRREHRARLEKLEAQITRLVDCIADGTGGPSSALRERLRLLEREADAERRSFAAAESSASKPIKLPTPKEMIRIVFDLERRLMADVTKGREELRRLFRDGRIDLIPQPGRFYVARSEILPLVLLTRDSPEGTAGFVRYTGSSCAGANRPISTYRFIVPKPKDRRTMPHLWKRTTRTAARCS